MSDTAPPRSEPAVNAPWPLLGLIAALVLAHAWRSWLGAEPDAFAFSADDLAKGRWGSLFTHLFVHASWTHLLMNAVFILAFGSPVSRLMGSGPRGAIVFWIFFCVCGAAAALGFAAVAAVMARLGLGPADWALVGASGAASGLMGATGRLLEGRGAIGPIWGKTVAGLTIAWIVVNLLLGLTGLTPGTAGAPVAWQAHILGYFAGLILIGPFAALAGVHAHLRR
ncbi:MAG TPA: rhomboid family intramembrane serine protease [Caulobacteraceae bacterium]|jgi:membrane associated rhomboid family serine protease